jgi:hypothetical protein
LPDPVLPEKQLFKTVVTIKNDLERIKARIGSDITDIDEENNLTGSHYLLKDYVIPTVISSVNQYDI